MFEPKCQAVDSQVTSIFAMPLRMFQIERGSVMVIWRVPAQHWLTADSQQMGVFLTAGCLPL